MFWLRLAGKALQFAGGIAMLLASRWLLIPASYQEDVREARHLLRLLPGTTHSLNNWLDMLPYRFAVAASYELGIAQHNLKKLRARYERGEFANDSAPKPQSDRPADSGTSADGLDSGQQNDCH